MHAASGCTAPMRQVPPPRADIRQFLAFGDREFALTLVLTFARIVTGRGKTLGT